MEDKALSITDMHVLDVGWAPHWMCYKKNGEAWLAEEIRLDPMPRGTSTMRIERTFGGWNVYEPVEWGASWISRLRMRWFGGRVFVPLDHIGPLYAQL